MASLLLADGRTNMRNVVWPETFSAGMVEETSAYPSIYNEATREYYMDQYRKKDDALKSVLLSNGMELEDLFMALAVQCDGTLQCYIASTAQYDCCRLVSIHSGSASPGKKLLAASCHCCCY